jgi:hypothetical protein
MLCVSGVYLSKISGLKCIRNTLVPTPKQRPHTIWPAAVDFRKPQRIIFIPYKNPSGEMRIQSDQMWLKSPKEDEVDPD